MSTNRFPLTFNANEMVIVTEGHIDLALLKKQGWTNIQFIGYATIHEPRAYLRFFPRIDKVPMYKLTKEDP